MVEDLTEVYANCISPRIKAMYNSYGPQLLGAGTFDGKLMALPEAVIDHGPCLLWMRKDWMDQLGLAEPKTLEEAMDIIQGASKLTPWFAIACDPAVFTVYGQMAQAIATGDETPESAMEQVREAAASLH